MADTKPLLVLEVLRWSAQRTETNQTPTCQNLFPQTTIWAVFGTEALSRTHVNLDPCRCLLGAGGWS